jgi:hypothetical protein
MSPPKNANGQAKPTERERQKSTAPRLKAETKSVKPRRELSYREICEIMGRNLRVIVTAEPEPEQEQLELFDAAQGGRQ